MAHLATSHDTDITLAGLSYNDKCELLFAVDCGPYNEAARTKRTKTEDTIEYGNEQAVQAYHAVSGIFEGLYSEFPRYCTKPSQEEEICAENFIEKYSPETVEENTQIAN